MRRIDVNLKIIIVIGIVVIAGIASSIFLLATNDDTKMTEIDPNLVTAENCIGEECLEIDGLEYPTAPLPAGVLEAMNAALDNQYKTIATYEAVIETFGSTRPFSMVIRTEEKHLASIKSLYDKYDIAIPSDQYDPYEELKIGNSRAENCAVAVETEIDTAEVYREILLPAVTEFPDVTEVFSEVMNSSQDRHLPAFESCAS